jgi:hypothetical protein
MTWGDESMIYKPTRETKLIQMKRNQIEIKNENHNISIKVEKK